MMKRSRLRVRSRRANDGYRFERVELEARRNERLETLREKRTTLRESIKENRRTREREDATKCEDAMARDRLAMERSVSTM